MENNVYAGLFGIAAFGLFLGIEWLFLTFAFLGIVLLVLSRTSPKAGGLSGASVPGIGDIQYTQPVVVQNNAQSLGHDYYMNIINNQVAEAMKQQPGH